MIYKIVSFFWKFIQYPGKQGIVALQTVCLLFTFRYANWSLSGLGFFHPYINVNIQLPHGVSLKCIHILSGPESSYTVVIKPLLLTTLKTKGDHPVHFQWKSINWFLTYIRVLYAPYYTQVLVIVVILFL